MTRFAMALGAGTAALLAGCGGSNPPAAATTTTTTMMSSSGMGMSMNTSCAPSGTTLQHSTDCLAAPAGQAFTIHFDNMDPLSHDVTIFTADPDTDKNAKKLFQGDLDTGPKAVDYAVPAQPAGNYHYHCSVHPTQMYGTLVVK
jgi:plastocyanin